MKGDERLPIKDVEIKNEHPVAKTFRYEMLIEDMEEKIIKQVTGNEMIIQPDETKSVGVHDKVENLHFRTLRYGCLYNVSANSENVKLPGCT